MSSISTGGGTSAVAASTHAGCQRFRGTDPLITRKTRRQLAKHIGYEDSSAGIPESRWMRAVTFERLVYSREFASELLTTAVGQLRLDRPDSVQIRDGETNVHTTASELESAHIAAMRRRTATMLVRLAIPYIGLESYEDATPVKPDFAIVCPRKTEGRLAGSWLIMGDAKDYERIRSRIDDSRLLKGFLQIALGAESARMWSRLPEGMEVHDWGALAVPRNAFLRPEAVVEDLRDHSDEVRGRAGERISAQGRTSCPADEALSKYVAELPPEFDPASCVTCSLFNYCREQLRSSDDPAAVLTEIGVDKSLRTAVHAAIDGDGDSDLVPTRVLANVNATFSGVVEWSDRLRTDPVGRPGTINIVASKSDSAALGVYGIALQVIGKSGAGKWKYEVFDDSRTPETRQRIMSILGSSIESARGSAAAPIHLVVPDSHTSDLLVSIADSLAGLELSRLRWQRDIDQKRPVLTFDGQPATPPTPLSEHARLAVSFLLEDDRSRGLLLRSPIVDLREVLASHVLPGGPAINSGRLDYLVTWGEARTPLDHRGVSDRIEKEVHTPGARLSNQESNLIHSANGGGQATMSKYRKLVASSLEYKTEIFDRAVAIMASVGDSKLLDAFEAAETDAQAVWQRRVALQASELVRFSRTSRVWRNDQVEIRDADALCFRQLTALLDVLQARDWGLEAGVRELATARVQSVDPIRLTIDSRHLVQGRNAVLLHVNDVAVVELPTTTLKIQKGSFKLGNMSIGPLLADRSKQYFRWDPLQAPELEPGDELVLADASWFNTFHSGHEIAVVRPKLDTNSAPKSTCTLSSYRSEPQQHRWCCRPTEVAEAEWSDILAGRRARGELNPVTWPPVIDQDRFDVREAGTSDSGAPIPKFSEQGITSDDLD